MRETATEMRKAIEEQQQENQMFARYHHFLERWAPQDFDTRSEFDAELIMLIRAVSADASKEANVLIGTLTRLHEATLSLVPKRFLAEKQPSPADPLTGDT